MTKNNNDNIMQSALHDFIVRMNDIGSRIDLEPYESGDSYYPHVNVDGKPSTDGRSCYITITHKSADDNDADNHSQIVYNYDVYSNGAELNHYETTVLNEIMKHVYSGIVFMIASREAHYDNNGFGSNYQSRMFAKQIELMTKLGYDYGEYEQEHVNNMRTMEYLK